MRANATRTEKLLWEELRGNKLGHKFKRQHSVGGYILDFFCPTKRLIVEIDGSIHDVESQKKYDQTRDIFFQELGYGILRLNTSEIESKLDDVLRKIKRNLDETPFSLPRRRAGMR